jgi:NitT/TauT family transport system substrate-binding protein
MKHLFKLLWIFIFIGSGSASAQSEHQQLRFMLQWLPQAQFAGYYMAQEKGLYQQQGIDLTILDGGPDKIVSDDLDSGKVDFGLMFLATALERRSSGLKIVNIGQIIQHSSLMLIARADAGINEISDLDGKKVSLWANEFQIQPRMLFQKLGIEVEIIPQTNSLALFLHQAVSATSAMWYNEYHTLLCSGLRKSELQPFFFRDTPYDFPEDGIYCLESTFEKNPEVIKGLLVATVKGWQYAFDHEEEALDLVTKRMQEANLPVNRVHQRWMLQRMRDLLVEGDSFSTEHCHLEKSTFNQIVSSLTQSGMIQSNIDYSSFFRGPQQ